VVDTETCESGAFSYFRWLGTPFRKPCSASSDLRPERPTDLSAGQLLYKG
jgi:hypothetical protein